MVIFLIEEERYTGTQDENLRFSLEDPARTPLIVPYRASQVLARVGFLYLRFLTIQLQAHPPTVDAHELHRVALTRHLNEILRGVAF